MTEHDKGVRVTNCPIKREYCYPSCYWWAKNGCSYDAYCQKGLVGLVSKATASEGLPGSAE